MAGLVQNIPLIGQEIPWLKTFRDEGKQAFERQGIPAAKREDWKYTKPRVLNTNDYVMRSSRHAVAQKLELPLEAFQIHFENGIFDPAQSELPTGVEVLPLIEVLLEAGEARAFLGKLIDYENHPFAALNSAYINEGVFIRVEKNVELKKPLVLVSHTTAENDNLFYNLRNLIILEEGARARFIEYYHYSGEVKSRYFANITNEIFLAPKACLEHYKVQKEAFKANHIALTTVSAAANSAYHGFTLQLGADLSRNETLVKLQEKEARAEVNAAYQMNGWATLDTTTNIEHLATCTYSDQLVKGVVGGDAKGIFQGKIHIAPGAVKTEGRQLHKALLLSDSAEIDVKPELEIFADDVKCSHGAASGELDEEALFYMQSRGISREQAKQLLIDAYLEDAFAKIADASVRDWLKGLL